MEETLHTLEYALPFRPMRAVEFWLGLGSPVWRYPRNFGVRAVFNHPSWSILLPSALAKRIPFMIQAYRGDRTAQKRLWKPVKDKLAEWKRSYEALHNRPQAAPILAYRDGGDFLIIRQRRIGDDPLNHRLTGASRQIYLFCDQCRSLTQIVAAFSPIGEDRLRSFLAMMVDKKLMFSENSQYLSLAIAAHPRRAESGRPD